MQNDQKPTLGYSRLSHYTFDEIINLIVTENVTELTIEDGRYLQRLFEDASGESEIVQLRNEISELEEETDDLREELRNSEHEKCELEERIDQLLKRLQDEAENHI